MKYTLTTPCDTCPFLDTPNMRAGFTLQRLHEFARGEFACHKTCVEDDGEFRPREGEKESLHCAGALLFLEKRGKPHQMMRVCNRLGFYDPAKLNPSVRVR